MSRANNTTKALALVLEVVLTLIVVSLFCCAYPDQYRTSLWEAGGEKGWNSNPRLRIYYYANHQEPPEIPLIWSEGLTISNLSIALVTVGICVVRMVLMVLEFDWIPIDGFYNTLLAALWYYSVSAQASADLTDLDHPSLQPWYLQHGCREVDKQYFEACTIAKVSYGFSIVLMIFYAARSMFSVCHFMYWCGKHRLAEVCIIKLNRYIWQHRILGKYGQIAQDDEESRLLAGFLE